jgi:hypothetical protein
MAQQPMSLRPAAPLTRFSRHFSNQLAGLSKNFPPFFEGTCRMTRQEFPAIFQINLLDVSARISRQLKKMSLDQLI